MKRMRTSPCLLVLIVLAGCASTNITERQSNIGNEKLARPERIIVHNFAVTLADVPAESAAAGQFVQPSAPQTAEQIETGRKLGAQIAKNLVAQIQDMGLAVEYLEFQGGHRLPPVVFDAAIRVYVERGFRAPGS